MKVTYCFICPKNSPGVWIAWLKGYLIFSACDDARAEHKCSSNFRTPCIIVRQN